MIKTGQLVRGNASTRLQPIGKPAYVILFSVHRILKAKQANLVEKWYKYYSPAKPCPSPQRPHAGSSVVTLANVLYVFLILVFGLGVSLTTFIIEVASRIQSPNP